MSKMPSSTTTSVPPPQVTSPAPGTSPELVSQVTPRKKGPPPGGSTTENPQIDSPAGNTRSRNRTGAIGRRKLWDLTTNDISMAETDDIKTLLQYAFEKPSTDFDGASADDIPYSLKLVYHAFHLKVPTPRTKATKDAMSKLLPQIREGAPAAWKEHCPEVGKMEMQEYIEGIFKGGTYKWHTGDEGMRWLLTDNEMGYLYSLQDHDIRNLLEGALSLEGFCVSNLQYEVEGNVIRTASKLVFYSFYQEIKLPGNLAPEVAAKLGQIFGYFRDHAAEVYKNQPLEKAGLSLKDYITSITQSVDAFGFKLRELENDGVEQETGGTGGGGEEEGTSGGAGGGRKNSGEAEPQEPANEGKEREAGDKGGGGKSDEEGDKKSKELAVEHAKEEPGDGIISCVQELAVEHAKEEPGDGDDDEDDDGDEEEGSSREEEEDEEEEAGVEHSKEEPGDEDDDEDDDDDDGGEEEGSSREEEMIMSDDNEEGEDEESEAEDEGEEPNYTVMKVDPAALTFTPEEAVELLKFLCSPEVNLDEVMNVLGINFCYYSGSHEHKSKSAPTRSQDKMVNYHRCYWLEAAYRLENWKMWTMDKTTKSSDAVPGRHIMVNPTSPTSMETFKAEVKESWQGVKFKIVLVEYLSSIGPTDAKTLCSVHLPVLCKEYGTEVVWLPKTENFMKAYKAARSDLRSAGLVRHYEVSDPIGNPLYKATRGVTGDGQLPSELDKDYPFVCLEIANTRFGLRYLEEKLKKRNDK